MNCEMDRKHESKTEAYVKLNFKAEILVQKTQLLGSMTFLYLW